MSTLAREGSNALAACIKITESVCSLPAVATQDWCDRAASALLGIHQPSICVCMIGEADSRGNIARQEATGVAGCYVAEVTTTVGRPASSAAIVAFDPNDATLARVRTSFAQARDLSWAPGPIGPGSIVTGSPEQFGLGPNWQMSGLGKRWADVPYTSLTLGLAALGSAANGRSLIVEFARTGPGPTDPESDADLLRAVLVPMARRALLAVGSDPTDGAHWLTAREQVILQHLLLGKSVREIADELGRSPHTVHDHVKSLHRKLRANSRGELVAKALGHVELMQAASQSSAPADAAIAEHNSQQA
ncbi:MAG: response regulator transcription factor [Phycisphaeraceae bacterium]|nr:response regulator transcription factor [Phycisphaeraceae bacterium]